MTKIDQIVLYIKCYDIYALSSNQVYILNVLIKSNLYIYICNIEIFYPEQNFLIRMNRAVFEFFSFLLSRPSETLCTRVGQSYLMY